MHRVARSLIRERGSLVCFEAAVNLSERRNRRVSGVNFIETRFSECGELTGLATLEIGQELGCVLALAG